MGRPTFAPEIGPTGSPVLGIAMTEKMNNVRDPRTGVRLPGVPTYHCDVTCSDGTRASSKWVDGLGWVWLDIDGRGLPGKE